MASAFEKIKAVADGLSIFSCPDVYTKGDKSEWITYNLADDHGAAFSDDLPAEFVADVQVHLFLPIDQNFIPKMHQIRAGLMGQGFTCPDITTMVEADTHLRHIVFECEIVEAQ